MAPRRSPSRSPRSAADRHPGADRPDHRPGRRVPGSHRHRGADDLRARPDAGHAGLQDPPADINGWLNAPQLNLVGTFDPAKVSDGSSALSAVPMPTYFPDTATGANAASVRALGGEPLRPNGDMAGLLSVSPSLLTTISSLPELENPNSFQDTDLAHGVNTAAPISVIRVKLTGTVGLDAASQARLRLVAQEIYQRTGLLVDITQGSSQAPVTVIDPAGLYGRPQLELSEMWSRMGAAELISSWDRHEDQVTNEHTCAAAWHRIRGQRGGGFGTQPATRARHTGVRRMAEAVAVRPDFAADARSLAVRPGWAERPWSRCSRPTPLTGARYWTLGTYVALAVAAPLLTCVAGALSRADGGERAPRRGHRAAARPDPARPGQGTARCVTGPAGPVRDPSGSRQRAAGARPLPARRHRRRAGRIRPDLAHRAHPGVPRH